MPTTLTRSAEQVILVASMIASRLLLGPCAAFQQVQVLLEVAIQHHYDIMPAQHFTSGCSKSLQEGLGWGRNLQGDLGCRS